MPPGDGKTDDKPTDIEGGGAAAPPPPQPPPPLALEPTKRDDIVVEAEPEPLPPLAVPELEWLPKPPSPDIPPGKARLTVFHWLGALTVLQVAAYVVLVIHGDKEQAKEFLEFAKIFMPILSGAVVYYMKDGKDEGGKK